jgi:hypothetical protein
MYMYVEIDSVEVVFFTIFTLFFSLICICECVILCVFTFGVPCCDVRDDFLMRTMFGSSLPPVVCRMSRVLFTLFVCVLKLLYMITTFY